jgi:hypothetical protein
MKKIAMIAFAAVLAVALIVPSVVMAVPEGIPDDAERLYKFNIIGVDNPKKVDMDGDNGKRIFVDLNDVSAIYLVQAFEEDGETPMAATDPGAFDILDANGTDADGATLQLPSPGLEPYVVGAKGDADVWSDYSIYIRSLGKPGGWATITTCAELEESALFAMLPNAVQKMVTNNKGQVNPDAYASIEQVGKDITERPKGKSSFTNVTAELTTIVFSVWLDLDGDGYWSEDELFMVRVPIFDPMLEGEYWEYDNHGLKNLQVWIYDNSTDVSEDDGDLVPNPPDGIDPDPA